jgi:hypothetical protein
MDRQAIDVHGRIAFSNANCALPETSQKRRWWKVRFWPRLWENTKNQSATRMMFSDSMSKLNWLAMWAHKAVLNE